MSMIVASLLIARLATVAILIVIVLFAVAQGREPGWDLLIGFASGSYCLLSQLLFLSEISLESETPGKRFTSFVYSIAFLALALVHLGWDEPLTVSFRIWAAGVYGTWVALLLFGMTKIRRDERPAEPAPQGPGWTMEQLAFVLMLFGVGTVLITLKHLMFGPPPHSSLAYAAGPCLAIAGYLVEPGVVQWLVTEAFKRPEPPANNRR